MPGSPAPGGLGGTGSRLESGCRGCWGGGGRAPCRARAGCQAPFSQPLGPQGQPRCKPGVRLKVKEEQGEAEKSQRPPPHWSLRPVRPRAAPSLTSLGSQSQTSKVGFRRASMVSGDSRYWRGQGSGVSASPGASALRQRLPDAPAPAPLSGHLCGLKATPVGILGRA